MSNEEAREILGFRKGDVLLKAGLNGFKAAYKRWLKDPNSSEEIKATVKRSLEALEVLLNE